MRRSLFRRRHWFLFPITIDHPSVAHFRRDTCDSLNGSFKILQLFCAFDDILERREIKIGKQFPHHKTSNGIADTWISISVHVLAHLLVAWWRCFLCSAPK